MEDEYGRYKATWGMKLYGNRGKIALNFLGCFFVIMGILALMAAILK